MFFLETILSSLLKNFSIFSPNTSFRQDLNNLECLLFLKFNFSKSDVVAIKFGLIFNSLEINLRISFKIISNSKSLFKSLDFFSNIMSEFSDKILSITIKSIAGDIFLNQLRGNVNIQLQKGDINLQKTTGQYIINLLEGKINGHILLNEGVNLFSTRFGDFDLKLQPYFLIQRSLMGESNAFRLKDSSVLSDNKKINIDLDEVSLKSLDELFYHYGSDKSNIFKKTIQTIRNTFNKLI